MRDLQPDRIALQRQREDFGGTLTESEYREKLAALERATRRKVPARIRQNAADRVQAIGTPSSTRGGFDVRSVTTGVVGEERSTRFRACWCTRRNHEGESFELTRADRRESVPHVEGGGGLFKVAVTVGALYAHSGAQSSGPSSRAPSVVRCARTGCVGARRGSARIRAAAATGFRDSIWNAHRLTKSNTRLNRWLSASCLRSLQAPRNPGEEPRHQRLTGTSRNPSSCTCGNASCPPDGRNTQRSVVRMPASKDRIPPVPTKRRPPACTSLQVPSWNFRSSQLKECSPIFDWRTSAPINAPGPSNTRLGGKNLRECTGNGNGLFGAKRHQTRLGTQRTD